MIKHILTLIWNKRSKNGLLLTEILLAFLILFAVSAVVISGLRKYWTPRGFDPSDTLTFRMTFDESSMDSLQLVNAKRLLKSELQAMPEIETVAFGNITPYSQSMSSLSNDDNGFEMDTWLVDGDENMQEALDMKLVNGRWFTAEDANSKYQAVIINKKLYDAHFKDRNLRDSIYEISGECRIVGVVDHYKYSSDFSEEPNMTIRYEPFHNSSSVYLERSPGVDASFDETLHNKLKALMGNAYFTVEHLDELRKLRSQSYWIPIISLVSISGFLTLNVALGLFGVLWYNISKRRSEIGVRRSMGATRGSISRQFTGEVLAVSLVGILLGTFFAIQAPYLGLFDLDKSNYYYGILFAALLIILLVLFCALYPSRQASRVHPAVALHEE